MNGWSQQTVVACQQLGQVTSENNCVKIQVSYHVKFVVPDVTTTNAQHIPASVVHLCLARKLPFIAKYKIERRRCQ